MAAPRLLGLLNLREPAAGIVNERPASQLASKKDGPPRASRCVYDRSCHYSPEGFPCLANVLSEPKTRSNHSSPNANRPAPRVARWSMRVSPGAFHTRSARLGTFFEVSPNRSDFGNRHLHSRFLTLNQNIRPNHLQSGFFEIPTLP
jgi:hypothetical protein